MKKLTLIILPLFIFAIILIAYNITGKNKEVEDNNQKEINCEQYSIDDCPKECFFYIGPSVCSDDLCTDDIIELCLSEEYTYEK